jgi:outer membrane protein OmpA-like peptidoglycan-associated protein
MDLSRRRATSVRNFLIKEGCKADKMTIVGHGSTMPVASNETEEGRRKNRRVEITFKK